MLVINLEGCAQLIAGDNTVLREILHPDKQSVQLRYSLAHALVRPGEVSLKHRLATSEVYFILQGTGTMFIDGEQAPVAAGDTIYIPPHSVQSIRNSGQSDLVFLCIVDPAWRAEDEEVL